MSSTPFWLANTGGSTRFAASAAPPPATAAATPAAPINCIDILGDDCLLNMERLLMRDTLGAPVSTARAACDRRENGRSRRLKRSMKLCWTLLPARYARITIGCNKYFRPDGIKSRIAAQPWSKFHNEQ